MALGYSFDKRQTTWRFQLTHLDENKTGSLIPPTLTALVARLITSRMKLSLCNCNLISFSLVSGSICPNMEQEEKKFMKMQIKARSRGFGRETFIELMLLLHNVQITFSEILIQKINFHLCRLSLGKVFLLETLL